MTIQEYIRERKNIVDSAEISDGVDGSIEYVNTYSQLGLSERHVIAVFHANELLREELYDTTPDGKEYRAGTVYHAEKW